MNEKLACPLPRRLMVNMVLIIALLLGLCVTTYALTMVSDSVPDNYFQTGVVSINLNDGEPVIREDEFLFEPGMTVTKRFFIKNEGTADVYCKLYLDQVRGGLATVLTVTISDGDTVLLQGTAAELTGENVNVLDDVLRLGQKRELTISFQYPEYFGNASGNSALSFRLCADAVQVANNPEKRFQ